MKKSIEGQVSTGLSNSNSTQSMLMQRRGSSIFSFGGGAGGGKPPMSRRDSTSSQSRYDIIIVIWGSLTNILVAKALIRPLAEGAWHLVLTSNQAGLCGNR